MRGQMPDFYEMFAGAGMARAGFGRAWRCLFANDICATKAETYRANWGADALRLCDVAELAPVDLPGRADAVWASFPCQDLSLAGAAAGLGEAEGARTRSGAFWPFHALMRGLAAEGRAPRALALENVTGTLTSRGGRDFAALAGALAEAGRVLGALVIDARLFLPQSRPRLFLLGFDPRETDLSTLPRSAGPVARWHPPRLVAAQAALPEAARARWLWLAPPAPPARDARLADLLEDDPPAALWRPRAETDRVIAMMSPANREKLAAAQASGRRMVGTLYRRMRVDRGRRTQRAEIRFDDVAGCLRTPAGGSSRQSLLIVEGERVRLRLLSAREAARLMGLDDRFVLPARYNDAYRVAGDGVAVPVVRHVVETLIEPALGLGGRRAAA